MERLSMMGGGGRAIIGEPAPRFTSKAVVNGRIRGAYSTMLTIFMDFTDICIRRSLQRFMADKQWLMLFFYPSARSFVCPTEIFAFDARSSEFSSRQCAVVFTSTDSEHVLKAWNSFESEEGGLGGVNIPLVADRSHRISRDYGVLIEEDGVAQRATFIIDPTGTIRSVTVCDANIG
jgi:alkyl hydroperoxide reductase subunit AhpC